MAETRGNQSKQGAFHSERSYGSFYRALPLPDDIESDTCKANFKNGVLEVELKVDENKRRSRRIEIE